MAASEQARSKLESAIEDLVSLDVVTLSGDLVVDVAAISTETDGRIRFQDVMKNIRGNSADNGSHFSTIAATHVALDKDTVQFVRAGLTVEEERLFKLHLQAVETAVAARAAMVESLMRIAGLK